MSADEQWAEKSGERLTRLAAFPEQNPDPALECDDRGLVYANPAALALFPDLYRTGNEHPFISASERIASGLRESGGDSGTGEIELAGTRYQLDVHLVPDTGGLRAYAKDITERKRAWRLLAESERRFRQLFDRSSEAIFLHDTLGRIVDCNEEACASLGYTREELLSLSVEDFVMDVLPGEERRQREEEPWKQAVRTGPGVQASFHKNEHRRKDGSTFSVEVGIGAMDYGGEHLVLASARDISGRRLLEEELAHRTHHDPLTELPNRKMLDSRLERAIPDAEHSGERLAVMFLHLGGLDSARERLGHRMGDHLLAAAAQRIRGCLGLEDIICRVGDDLVVLANGMNGHDHAVRTAVDILEELSVTLEDGESLAQTTIGIALLPGYPDLNPLDRAYEAACQARRRGDAYHIFP